MTKHYYITTSGDNMLEAINNLKLYLENPNTASLYEIAQGERLLTIDDNLDGLVEQIWSEVEDALKAIWLENPEYTAQDVIDELEGGQLHEIIDGCVPVYTYDIKCLWFTHSNALEEVYNNTGIGENPRENNGMTAIYCYLDLAVRNKLSDWAG